MKQKYTFPARFLWGASTSAHQVEGGNHNQWSVSELENAKSRALQAAYKLNELPAWDEIKAEATKPSNYVSGRASDHYRRYEEDFDIVAKLNMNAFRFSIEWSRIEPEEGRWDLHEIEHYREVLRALRRRKIEPVVTLFHWTMPVWFAEKGGFEKRANIDYFVRFAEKVLDELGESIRLVCTFNEPEVYVAQGWLSGEWPPHKKSETLRAFWTYWNIARSHNRVAAMAHRRSRRFKCGVSKNCADHYAGDSKLTSKLMVMMMQYVEDYWFLNRIRRRMDWLGLNYYFANRYLNGKQSNPNERLSDLGWDMQPDNVQFVLQRLYRRYKKPIILTESGVADRGDRYRRWWIAHTIDAMHKAMQGGVRVEGYLHWSLLDNFEWAYGKWPRFGLVEVDYRTGERTVRPSAIWFGKVIQSLRKG